MKTNLCKQTERLNTVFYRDNLPDLTSLTVTYTAHIGNRLCIELIASFISSPLVFSNSVSEYFAV